MVCFGTAVAAAAPPGAGAAGCRPGSRRLTAAGHPRRRAWAAAADGAPAGSRGAPSGGAVCLCVALAVAAGARRLSRSRRRPAARRAVVARDVPVPTRTGRREALLAPAAAALGAGAAGRTSSARAAEARQSLQLPGFGVGTWAWGDFLFWGYDQKEDPELQVAFDYLIDNGVRLFDTAEVYGFNRSEDLLGRFIREKGVADVQVATKFAAMPWKLSRGDVVSACKSSLQRLGTNAIDLYQIHFPGPWRNEEFWDGLGDCYEQGLVKAVGVSNYGSDAVRSIHKVLTARGIPLASNQIQYSLVYRYPELNGMKATCDELGVKILAYSPLGLGMLTGKYTKEKLPSGPRAVTAQKYLEDPAFLDLLSMMRDVASKHGPDVTPSQTAVAWCTAKGTVPIPGVRNVRQAKDNVSAMSLALTPREVEDLDTAASKVQPVLSPSTAPFVRESVDTKRRLFEA
uniref:NADP-dependent oxidoreductase domain-containing protein n=1 Tax=Alexandrium monilatum TaxID=311494 RepID=A0A7S4T8C9_9DINO